MISVIMTACWQNVPVERAIQSVLRQTYADLELIVLDEGATGDLRKTIDSFRDGRIQYLRPTGLSHHEMLEYGLQMAGGQYIAFQRGNAEWIPEKLERQLQCLQETNADIVCCASMTCAGKLDGDEYMSARTMLSNMMQTMLGKRECFLENQRGNGLSNFQDWENVLRWIQVYQVRYDDDVMVKIHAVGSSLEAEDSLLEGAFQAQLNSLEAENDRLKRLCDTYEQSTSWKLTRPLRMLSMKSKKILNGGRLFFLPKKAWKYLRTFGVRCTIRRIHAYVFARKQSRRPTYTKAELERQRTKKFPRNIKFSILVPLYNTPPQFLRPMIESVLGQTYANWELCLADGSDADHAQVGEIAKEYAARDGRIKYQKLERNLGISGNTNACIDMATGDYIVLFDHDDLLHPAALYENAKAICEQDADFLYSDENTFHIAPKDAYCPNYKPDFAPDTLRSYNYICHLTVFRAALLDKTGGGFRPEFDGSQDYDMILRLTEQAQRIVHIPRILYYWRSHANSVASDVQAKPYTLNSAKKALAAHLERVGLDGEVEDARIPSTYRIRYHITGEPLISILIPNKDHTEDLKKCINSIRQRTTYRHWEIVIIENNSELRQTFQYYEELEHDPRIRVVRWTREFNYSAINNFGALSTKGDYLLLLNNDVEVITPDWLEQMLMFAQRKDVGAVGSMLYYPDDTIQHAGAILGIGGVAGHSHKYFRRGEYGYMSRLAIAQNLSAVTGACLMLRKDVWQEVGGLDEAFQVAFNDIDLCMRIRKAGYLIVWTPYAELYHFESKSRGIDDTPVKQARFAGEIDLFRWRWEKELRQGDPYYNPNLTLDHENFGLR